MIKQDRKSTAHKQKLTIIRHIDDQTRQEVNTVYIHTCKNSFQPEGSICSIRLTKRFDLASRRSIFSLVKFVKSMTFLNSLNPLVFVIFFFKRETFLLCSL